MWVHKIKCVQRTEVKKVEGYREGQERKLYSVKEGLRRDHLPNCRDAVCRGSRLPAAVAGDLHALKFHGDDSGT